MRSVNIAELKNRLSAYVTFARGGEEIIIREAICLWPSRFPSHPGMQAKTN